MATEKEIEAATNAIAECMRDDCDMRSDDPIRAYAEAALRAAAPASPAAGEEELARLLSGYPIEKSKTTGRWLVRLTGWDIEPLVRAILARSVAADSRVKELEAANEYLKIQATMAMARAEKAEASLAEARNVIESFRDWLSRNSEQSK